MTQPGLFEESLDAARQVVADNLTTGGITCPCCNRKARAWRLSIHSGMVRWLIELFRESYRTGEIWIDVKTVNQASQMFGGDYAKLKFWDMIEPMNPETCPDEKRSIGLWRITKTGIQFLEGAHCVPQYIWTYNNEIIDSPEPENNVFIGEINKFDYREFYRELLL